MAFIALGVTGGIGAYKSVEVCRGLQKRGHDVVVVMSQGATNFVGPLTFEAITRRPVITSQWTPGANATIEHIAVADTIDLLVVAPATANVIGKFAHGIADDFLTSLYLATRAPVLVAPAMNSNMWAHPAVEANLQALAGRGVGFVDPGEGYLACGWIGKGRLAEPDAIVDAAHRRVTGPSDSPFSGRRVVVSAGPTYEDIDPVRYVGNRSSGRMGYALAAAAKHRGAVVTLVSGPTAIAPPAVDAVVRVRGAREMHRAMLEASAQADVIVMAAAVADYAPTQVASDKIAKSDAPLTVTLERTPDILTDLGGRPGREQQVLVGFAAETSDVLAKARAKRVRKQVDFIVANDVSAEGVGFEVETNAVTIVGADGDRVVSLRSKGDVAEAILDAVGPLVAARCAGR